jgi:hypothetical protein
MELTYSKQQVSKQLVVSGNDQPCYFCKSELGGGDKLYNATHQEKTIKVCPLCDIIVNNKKKHIEMCLLCYSELSQKKIIKETRKYYDECGNIPLPREIDPDVSLISLPVYMFAQFEDKTQFENYRVFFTNKIKDELESSFAISFEETDGPDLMQYYEMKEYTFSEEEVKLIKKELNNIKKNNFSIMEEKEEILRKRYQII